MNSYIQILINFFYQYADELISDKIISEINKSQINIDYLSKNKKGDIASNFYLIIKKKIIDNNYNFELNFKEKIIKLDFIDNFVISKNGFINFILKKNLF